MEELREIAASLRARVQAELEMGLTELLSPKDEGLRAPVPPPAAASVPRPEPAVAPSKADALVALRDHIGECTRCPLHSGRRSIVFGEGSPEARLVFVGEGPGQEEDEQGRPFVGPAGQLLTKIIAAIGLDRADVYICNVVKCRPPRNRVPEAEEEGTCGPFLERQLEVIDPEVIVCLGATAAKYLLGSDAPVGRLRGRFHARGRAAVMPTYHPAYLLRTPEAKRPVWEDMKLVRDRLGLVQ